MDNHELLKVVNNLIDTLTTLSLCHFGDNKINKLVHTTEKILHLIFKVFFNKIKINESDQISINKLLDDNIDKIEFTINRHIDSFPVSTYYGSCIIRSALQFLIDEKCFNDIISKTEIDIVEFDDKFAKFIYGFENPIIELKYYNISLDNIPSHHLWFYY